MQLVLDGLEEQRGFFRAWTIVGRHREDLAHPQVHAPFAGTYVADAFKQFIEVVGDAGTFDRGILQPLVVHGESLHQVLAQALRCPLAELGTAGRPHPVAHGQDGLQTVVVQCPADLAIPLGLNYPEFPDSSFRFALLLVIDVGEVLANGLATDC